MRSATRRSWRKFWENLRQGRLSARTYTDDELRERGVPEGLLANPQMQQAVFKLLGISDEEAQVKFGFLLEALKYGCPPHGGIAFGLDRVAALMSGEESIRDVIAFPKTNQAQCLLTSAPSLIPDEQVAELHIKNLKRDD